jgi:hypothetical protein
VTTGTLPLTVKVIPLSREDLSSQTRLQLTASAPFTFTAGEINALAQQALNGDLDACVYTMMAMR